jgi:prepilin-type N-terminal cleavage/methylation domain-containing protein
MAPARGFTLPEVAVALLILALGFAALPRLTPRVRSSGQVLLDLRQEVSEVQSQTSQNINIVWLHGPLEIPWLQTPRLEVA